MFGMSAGMAAAVIGGSAIVGGVIASEGAKSAAKTQANASQAAMDSSVAEQQRQYDQTRQDWAPWRAAGERALNRLNAASNGDTSQFYNDPSYSFTRSEGMRGLEQSNAARGMGRGGNALKALTQFNQNLASTQYGDWWNRQSGLAGIGQAATSATSAAGANAANNISNAFYNGNMAMGDARASGIMGSANSWNNSLNSGLNNYLLMRGGYFGNMGGGSASQMAQGSGWLKNYGTGWMGK